MKYFFLLNLLLTSSLWSQNELQIDLTFGNYFNDHNAKKFHIKERRWLLTKGELIYVIDEYDKRYTDTLKLTNSDLDSIQITIEKKKLNQNVDKKFENKHLKYSGHSAVIKGFIINNSKESKILIKGHSTASLSEKQPSKGYKELEYLLYRIIERYD